MAELPGDSWPLALTVKVIGLFLGLRFFPKPAGGSDNLSSFFEALILNGLNHMFGPLGGGQTESTFSNHIIQLISYVFPDLFLIRYFLCRK